MINVNHLKPGITFQEGQAAFVVLTAQHSKQGRGQATVKVKVKNLQTGAIVVKSYVGGDKVAPAHIEKKEFDFLYSDADHIFLMDQQTFEQLEIPRQNVAWEANFLRAGVIVKVRTYQQKVIDLELPANVELTVTQAPAAVKGNTQSNPQKKVKLETGFEIETPMFVNTGDKIIVSTAKGKYVGRGG